MAKLSCGLLFSCTDTPTSRDNLLITPKPPTHFEVLVPPFGLTRPCDLSFVLLLSFSNQFDDKSRPVVARETQRERQRQETERQRDRDKRKERERDRDVERERERERLNFISQQ